MAKKILLVEDDLDQIMMYKIELEKTGFQVLSADKEEAAIAMAKQEKPDLILLDLLIGNSSGIKILETLKADPETKELKIVVLSNFKKEGLPAKLKKLGALDYLLKTDYVPSALAQKINQYL